MVSVFFGFNPRPPITAGESSQAPGIREGVHVSIRARQLRRANPNLLIGIVKAIQFQSAPANYGGRIDRRDRKVLSILEVSIRARQLRRANLLRLSMDKSNSHGVSIRARQLRRANHPVDLIRAIQPSFQSAPANYGGRIAASERKP